MSLDVLRVRWHTISNLARCCRHAFASTSSDMPLMLGEVPTRGSARTAAAVAAIARDAGYAAAWRWLLQTGDRVPTASRCCRSLRPRAMRAMRKHVCTSISASPLVVLRPDRCRAMRTLK